VLAQVSDLYDPREQWASYLINAIKAKELQKRDVNYIVKQVRVSPPHPGHQQDAYPILLTAACLVAVHAGSCQSLCARTRCCGACHMHVLFAWSAG
jgi:SecA preprotein cross-linking domain